MSLAPCIKIGEADESVRNLRTALLAVNERHERLIDGCSPSPAASSGSPIQDLSTCRGRTPRHDRSSRRRTELKESVSPPTCVRPCRGRLGAAGTGTQNCSTNAIRYNLNSHGEITLTTGTLERAAQPTVESTDSLCRPAKSRACSSGSVGGPIRNGWPSPRSGAQRDSVSPSFARLPGLLGDIRSQEGGELVVRVELRGGA